MVICSRKQAKVDAAVATLRGEGLQVAGMACHVGEVAQLVKLVRFAVDTYGALDVVVSNAAVNPVWSCPWLFSCCCFWQSWGYTFPQHALLCPIYMHHAFLHTHTHTLYTHTSFTQ